MQKVVEEAVAAAQRAVDTLVALISALTGVVQSPAVIYETWLVDTLGPDGLWRPAWLPALNAEFQTKTGYVGGPEPDFDDGQSRRPVVLIEGFYFDLCLKRSDLTPEQRDNIHAKSQMAMGALGGLMHRDDVSGELRLPSYFTGPTDGPGEYPLAVPGQWYPDGLALSKAVRRYYELQYRT
jgi:hypothetical protein